MSLNRRQFIKLVGLGASGLLLAPQNVKIAKAAGAENEVAVLYDASKCVGCKACQNACKDWNDRPPEPDPSGLYDAPTGLSEKTWAVIQVVKPQSKDPFFFRRCQHCTEASCVAVCPTGAAHHEEGGIVVIDQDWCIGCGYCAEACPFGVPHLGHGEEKGSARKCWFCFDRLSEGRQPACAERCPTGALTFGDHDNLLVQGHEKVALLKEEGYPNANLYGDDELGGLHHMSILLDKPSVYGLPEAPMLSTTRGLASWLSGVVTAGIVAAAPFWLLFRRKKELATQET